MIEAIESNNRNKSDISQQNLRKSKPGIGNWLLMFCSRDSSVQDLDRIEGNDVATDDYYEDHAVVSPFRNE